MILSASQHLTLIPEVADLDNSFSGPLLHAKYSLDLFQKSKFCALQNRVDISKLVYLTNIGDSPGKFLAFQH